MKLPYLNGTQDSRQTTDTFLGYNHNMRIQDNEFYDMENLTADHAPVMAPRKARGLYNSKSTEGMIAKDSLCYVDGPYFVMNESRYDMQLSTKPKDCPKQLVSMGAYVIIMPDKKYFNTANPEDRGNIEATTESKNEVHFYPCRLDGTKYTPDYIQPNEPEEPANMAYWMDTSVTPHSLKQWSAGTNMWVSVATTYVRIESTGIGIGFKQYDGIGISGLQGLSVEDPEQLEALNGTAIIYAVGDDFITIVGILDAPKTISSKVTFNRQMPKLDFIIESDNRLWGCRYGVDNGGEIVNMLYASKLGDFKNWNCFMGISTDSYFVNLGSDGRFTGAVTHQGHPCFFKENVLHKVYGQIPTNFQVQNTACRGVQRGSERSLAIVNEILYYKSQHAICAYDGSLPQEMSTALGDEQYKEGIAAAHGNKYYCSMKDSSGKRALFVYDTAKGLWTKENDPGTKSFCSCRDELYCATEGGKIITMLGSGEPMERSVPWMAESGIINATLPDAVYLKKINIRMMLDVGSSAVISVQYDSFGEYEELAYLTGTDLRSFDIPVRPRRCDHLRLRMQGTGRCMIFSMTKSMSRGSDKA